MRNVYTIGELLIDFFPSETGVAFEGGSGLHQTARRRPG